MIIFLYGSDSYRSKKKLNEITAHYKKIHKSGMSFNVINADDASFEYFYKTINTVSMFGEKKLVVARDFLSGGVINSKDFSEKFISWEGKEHLASREDVICVFYEELPDKKNLLFAWLTQNSQSQEFGTLKGQRLQGWVQKFIKQENIKITQSALSRLVTHCEGDLWVFDSEIKKLKHYSYHNTISDRDLDIFLLQKPQTHIFSLVDATIEKNRSLALRLLHGHLEAGDNGQFLFSMVCNQFRNIAQVKSFLQRGEYNIPKIARETGIHPYVTRKSAEQAKRFDRAQIEKIYNKIVDLDINIKTGVIDARQGLESLILES